MTTDAEDISGTVPESYFWLGILFRHDANKWQFVDGTRGQPFRNWNGPISNGNYGALVIGKHQESVNPLSDSLYHKL